MKKSFKFATLVICLIVSVGLFSACGNSNAGEAPNQQNNPGNPNNTDNPNNPGNAASIPAKYVFFFVGDGMSTAQISSTEYFLQALEDHTKMDLKRLNFTQFPVAGLTNTHDASSLITDSASAGTAFATGRKTDTGMINVNPRNTSEEYKTIA